MFYSTLNLFMTECVSRCEMKIWRTFHGVSPAVDFYQAMFQNISIPPPPPPPPFPQKQFFSKSPSPTPSGNSIKLSSYFPYKFWPWRVPSTLGNFPVPSVGRVRIFSGTDTMHVTNMMNQNFFANLTYLMISRSIEGVRGIKP